MKGGRDSALMIGALLVGLVISAIVWFLAISPKLGSAQVAKEATQAQMDQNQILRATLLERQEAEESVPELTREILSIREILPPTQDVAAVRETLAATAAAAGYTIEGDNISPSVPIPGGLSLALQLEQVGLQSEIEGMLFTTLEASAFTLELVGPPENFWNLLERLRSSGDRYLYVTTINTTGGATVATDGLSVTVGGYIFILDRGVSTITKEPDERPWPGTEEEDPNAWVSPFGTIAPETAG